MLSPKTCTALHFAYCALNCQVLVVLTVRWLIGWFLARFLCCKGVSELEGSLRLVNLIAFFDRRDNPAAELSQDIDSRSSPSLFEISTTSAWSGWVSQAPSQQHVHIGPGNAPKSCRSNCFHLAPSTHRPVVEEVLPLTCVDESKCPAPSTRLAGSWYLVGERWLSPYSKSTISGVRHPWRRAVLGIK